MVDSMIPKSRYLIGFLRLLTVGSTVLLGGCHLDVLEPVGQVGRDESSIIFTATTLMLLVVVPVIVLTLLFARHYRASNTSAKYSPDWEHSNIVAAIMVLVPCSIVACLGTIAWKDSHRLDPYRPLVSAVKPITIDVIALNWKWLFIYPEGNVASVNEVALPTDTPVEFRITSASLMNSFFIPRLGSQVYAMAGMETQLHLIADEPGSYDGISANYSGAGFSDMRFKVIAMSPSAFTRWLADTKEAPALDLMEYDALARPGSVRGVMHFGGVSENLFMHVLHQFHMHSMSVTTTSEGEPQ